GRTENPTYEDVCRRDTGHAETVKVEYDKDVLPLGFLLELYYEAVDPLSLNRQGGDAGTQYRTGIYYADEADRPEIERSLSGLKARLGRQPAIEHGPLLNFYPAEEYHQLYLDKNPGGYCHIGMNKIKMAAEARVNPADYPAAGEETLKSTLSPLSYEVTQHAATEPPFQNRHWDNFRAGVYVDITSGEPLFASTDKFESGCGWPSFSKPIDPFVVREFEDNSLSRRRIEVKGRAGGAHLGHVFPDGPQELGGLRYCINSAALRFVPKAEMEREGYGYLLPLLEGQEEPDPPQK
ncbi:MAG TPA: peptide-methionine (R)-S-oxide reductase MsrB, partial [Feifaniaceae bacterium]|nr:peptide-methionine (R)-S-oxide reductase MsrB [Feifaniaceae bacterium]